MPHACLCHPCTPTPQSGWKTPDCCSNPSSHATSPGHLLLIPLHRKSQSLLPLYYHCKIHRASRYSYHLKPHYEYGHACLLCCTVSSWGLDNVPFAYLPSVLERFCCSLSTYCEVFCTKTITKTVYHCIFVRKSTE